MSAWLLTLSPVQTGIVQQWTEYLKQMTIKNTSLPVHIIQTWFYFERHSNSPVFLLFCFFSQERPALAVLSKLLVPGAEPDEAREPWPCHPQRPLHQQRHHPLGPDQRGRHPPFQEGQWERHPSLFVHYYSLITSAQHVQESRENTNTKQLASSFYWLGLCATVKLN